MSVENGALIMQIANSEQRFVLRGAEIVRVVVDGWLASEHTATIEYKDPFEVVPHFNIIVGSPDHYWIKAFAKMCRDKLNIQIERDECPF